ncbi:MAG: hypothetical protein JO127_18635 [Caulobacteraceae bacterium]|nr:hypothetical protein [Caulobacteraceae bacterium]
MARPWISEHYGASRVWARRTVGRRRSDRRRPLERTLFAAAVIAWAWCAYEGLQLLVR